MSKKKTTSSEKICIANINPNKKVPSSKKKYFMGTLRGTFVVPVDVPIILPCNWKELSPNEKAQRIAYAVIHSNWDNWLVLFRDGVDYQQQASQLCWEIDEGTSDFIEDYDVMEYLSADDSFHPEYVNHNEIQLYKGN